MTYGIISHTHDNTSCNIRLVSGVESVYQSCFSQLSRQRFDSVDVDENSGRYFVFRTIISLVGITIEKCGNRKKKCADHLFLRPSYQNVSME